MNQNGLLTPRCYWITGLSGSGKTTMANMLTNYLKEKNQPVIRLDGDVLRGIFNIKAYSNEDRYSLGLKYASLCKLILDHNVNVVIGVIGLFHQLHLWNRDNINEYCEIFLNTPIDELIERDTKGIYEKAFKGEIKNVAGIDLKVELPLNPDIEIKWVKGKNIEESFSEIIQKINMIIK